MIPLRDVIPSRTTPGVTLSLIAANILIYLFQLGLSGRGQDAFLFAFGLVPASFSIATMFTSMFVHGGFAHLAGNMLFLWIFGDNVEDRFGHLRFLGFYFVCGVVAAVSQVALYPGSTVPMVGASGAIAGVMGAYLVLYPRSRVLMLFPFPPILFELPALFFLVMWFVVQFLNGISSLPVFEQDAISGGVAFWAHIGGFVAGAVIGLVLRSRDNRWAAV